MGARNDTRAWLHTRHQEMLNELIRATQADSLLLDVAAGIVRDPDERRRLAEMSRRREVFAQQISDVVRALGGTPALGSSVRARARTMALRLRAAVMGTRDDEAYGVCAGMVAATARLYADAREAGLPEDAASVLASQEAEIGRDGTTLRRLWMGR